MNKNIPLVVHLIYRLDFGGLETLLVETINRMPAHKYRHAIVCLTDYTDFAEKITRPGVPIIALHKAAGLGLGTHVKLWSLLREMRPAILHTYNFSANEYALTAALAGVPIRIHAEHGRDASDPKGINPKHNMLRRFLVRFVDCYVPVSLELQGWLRTTIGIPDEKNVLINNGVDTAIFKAGLATEMRDSNTLQPDSFVIGTVGRIQDVKNHVGLVDAFILLRTERPADQARLRLAIIGDGPLLPALTEKINAAGIADAVWLPGARTDIAEIMQSFSVFALSSIAEGTPVTMLEAMSSGLPVVSTRVGGIPDLVQDGLTGRLVPPGDTQALAAALAAYLDEPALVKRHGKAGRERIEHHYSMSAMLAAYTSLYDRMCKTKTKFTEAIKPCVE